MLAAGKSGLTRAKKVQICMTLLAPFLLVIAVSGILNALLYVR
jgi:hypothetical protein